MPLAYGCVLLLVDTTRLFNNTYYVVSGLNKKSALHWRKGKTLKAKWKRRKVPETQLSVTRQHTDTCAFIHPGHTVQK